MTETSSPLAAAHQAIGAYFCAFSRVEHELGESVKVVFGLQGNEAADAIVVAIWDYAKKANLVRAASTGAKNADGSDASADWKDKVETTIKRVLKCNTDDRTALAHALLQPNTDGSVNVVRHGKGTGEKWSREAFGAKIEQLDKLIEELRALNDELRDFKYTIPGLGWMPTSNFDPTMGMMRPRGIPDVLRGTLPSG
jgi:hypothetical protein